MEHTAVLLEESIQGLCINPDGIYVDGTLGRGGHTAQIAKMLSKGRIIAIDRDREAIEESTQILSKYENIIHYVYGNYKDITKILDELGVELVDGMLFDFGVSSPQLDDIERGFSYMNDAPLDMRMDREDALSAYEAINTWSEDRLRQVLYEYGEERYARSIAKAIVVKRQVEQINTTFQLNDIIISAMPAKARREAQHPAKRSYQALRIAINDELESIKTMLQYAPDRLKAGGRICAISFHSLEDRLVKQEFNNRAKGCQCPKNMPICVCGIEKTLKIITKKPITPSEEEQERNPRSRSAKLRIAERI
ncbi:MAG: 16S rRNA (cytosine(1402)-N(4))-methyltransferase RsmH [Oscillospiraceae bacterium]|nr:16S rRNA (cytosine(1402)-N(4))-methyltransferase RsmH [Oscillospiraceae bacterium]